MAGDIAGVYRNWLHWVSSQETDMVSKVNLVMKSQGSLIFPLAQSHLLKLLSPSKQQHQLFKCVFKYTSVQGHEPMRYILYSNYSILSLPPLAMSISSYKMSLVKFSLTTLIQFESPRPLLKLKVMS